MTFRSAMGWMCATPSRPDRVVLHFEPLEARELLAGDFRTYDAVGNNPDHSDWGAAETQLLRYIPPEYADGVAAPAGDQRPSPRVISNTIVAQDGSIPNEQYLTDMLWAWGQFLDHDISLTDVAAPAEPFPIPVPQGDPYFDPAATGTATIPLDRSAYDPASGHSAGNPRQQMNAITAYIDASNVYGSDGSRAAALRTFSGGKMKTSPGDLLPYNVDHLPNAGGIDDMLFVAGDVRANEQVGLTALHTLFVREHNRLADEIAWSDPGLADEEIYQRARRLVGAQVQVITYQEFLPALLGAESLPAYQGYDPSVDAGIHNVFSTALYRFGHSMLSPQLLRLDNDGSAIDAGPIALRDAFFAPEEIAHYGIDSLLMGLSSQIAQEVDNHVVDDVRNFLFGDPGDGGFDLPALNIQRGRDHGLPDYNQVRAAYGLDRAGTFADITADTELQGKLKALYGDVNNLDPWVGALAEEHLPGAGVGQLIRTALVDQFQRLRDGDRYWYQHDLSPAEIAAVEHTTLADIIHRNTQLSNLQENVFYDRSVIYHRGGGEAVDGSLKVVGDTVQVIDNLTRNVLHSRWVDDVSKIVLVGSPQDDHFYIDLAWGNKPFSGQIEIHGVDGYDELLWAGTAGNDYMLVVDSQVRLNDQTASYFGMEAVKVWAGDGDDVIGVQSHPSLFVTVLGADGDDRIDGGDGNEVLLGGDGNDVVYAGAGDDYVEGGPGNDRLDGGTGNDQLYGQGGHDTLSGGPGHDLLFSGDEDVIDTAGFYRTTNSSFHLRNSNATVGTTEFSYHFGLGESEWIPLSGDWDGDGIDTVGFYRTTDSSFYLRNTNAAAGTTDFWFQYGPGGSEWIPLAGDWDGDGIDTVGFYRTTDSSFHLRDSNELEGTTEFFYRYGPGGGEWIPLTGDWNGDGVDTAGFYRMTDSTFHMRDSNAPTGTTEFFFGYGSGGLFWTPLAGDWDGDGTDTVGFYHAIDSSFHLRDSNALAGMTEVWYRYGPSGSEWHPLPWSTGVWYRYGSDEKSPWVPLTGDWDGDGTDTAGFYRTTDSSFHFRDSNTWVGTTEFSCRYRPGGSESIPLTGDWSGAGSPLIAAGGESFQTGPTARLTATEIQPIIHEAMADWLAWGLAATEMSRLSGIEFVIAFLPDAQLGWANGSRVYIDPTAAGYGWFVDVTPGEDGEFQRAAGQRDLTARPDGPVENRMDLLTVVMHEIGHALGYDHDEEGVMQGRLTVGTRRLWADAVGDVFVNDVNG